MSKIEGVKKIKKNYVWIKQVSKYLIWKEKRLNKI